MFIVFNDIFIDGWANVIYHDTFNNVYRKLIFLIMKNWIISLGTIIILSSLITIILPEGKLNKFIKCYLSLIIMIVIIQPITSIKSLNFNFENVFQENQIELQYDYLEYVANIRINNYIDNCKKIAKDVGVDGLIVEIMYEIDENNEIIFNNVLLNFKNSVIISDKEHIDIIEEVKTSICKYLDVEQNKVVIYE